MIIIIIIPIKIEKKRRKERNEMRCPVISRKWRCSLVSHGWGAGLAAINKSKWAKTSPQWPRPQRLPVAHERRPFSRNAPINTAGYAHTTHPLRLPFSRAWCAHLLQRHDPKNPKRIRSFVSTVKVHRTDQLQKQSKKNPFPLVFYFVTESLRPLILETISKIPTRISKLEMNRCMQMSS